jgi:hypothetical protein
MQSPQRQGTYQKFSTLALPLTPTVALSWSMITPKAKSSLTWLSFDINTSPSLCLSPRIGPFTVCNKALQVPFREPHLPRVSPNLRLLLIFKTSLNHGPFLHPWPSGPPAFLLQHIQGWTRRHFQGWPLPCFQLGPHPLRPAWLGVHHVHALPLALSCLYPLHFKLHPNVLILVMRISKGDKQYPGASTFTPSIRAPCTRASCPPHQVPCASTPCSLCFWLPIP